MKFNGYVVITYGLLMLIGGIIGFMVAGSTASLITGGVFSALLVASGIGMLKKSVVARFSAIGLSLLLTFFFSYRFYITKAFMPSALMMLVSLIVLIALGIAQPQREER